LRPAPPGRFTLTIRARHPDPYSLRAGKKIDWVSEIFRPIANDTSEIKSL
jgi:hypothetical protein